MDLSLKYLMESHSKKQIYSHYYSDLCEFFNRKLDPKKLSITENYILEALNSHDKERLKKKLIQQFGTDYNISFNDIVGKKVGYSKMAFQLITEYTKTPDLISDNKFISILQFFGYYLSYYIIIDEESASDDIVPGTYYTIAPTWAEDINDMVYNENNGILYHFTLGSKKESILKNGLRIKKADYREFPERIYLYSYFGNIKDKNNQYKYDVIRFIIDIIDINEIRKYGISVFKIDLNKTSFHIDFYTDDAVEDVNSVYTYNNIPSTCINCIDNISYNDLMNYIV